MHIYNMELFCEIKKELDLKSVMQDNGIIFNDKGKCCCFFHTENTASFSIKKDKYHCFGCGAHGDIFDFIEYQYGLDKFNAAKYLIDTYHLPIDIGIEKDPVKLKQARQEAKRLKRERESAERVKAYSQYAHRRILSYYYWLKEQERTSLIKNHIAWCERKIERLIFDNYLIDFDIDVRLKQMYRQIHPQPELSDDYFTGLIMAAEIGLR